MKSTVLLCDMSILIDMFYNCKRHMEENESVSLNFTLEKYHFKSNLRLNFNLNYSSETPITHEFHD